MRKFKFGRSFVGSNSYTANLLGHKYCRRFVLDTGLDITNRV